MTSALDGDEWSSSRPSGFTAGQRALGTHCIRGWIGPRTGLVDVERRKILPPTGSVPFLEAYKFNVFYERFFANRYSPPTPPPMPNPTQPNPTKPNQTQRNSFPV
jgi:hypothetical protein